MSQTDLFIKVNKHIGGNNIFSFPDLLELLLVHEVSQNHLDDLIRCLELSGVIVSNFHSFRNTYIWDTGLFERHVDTIKGIISSLCHNDMFQRNDFVDSIVNSVNLMVHKKAIIIIETTHLTYFIAFSIEKKQTEKEQSEISYVCHRFNNESYTYNLVLLIKERVLYYLNQIKNSPEFIGNRRSIYCSSLRQEIDRQK